jgi:hypothetical protein
MSDPQERERESADSEKTKFDEADERDAEQRREAAGQLRDEPPPQPRDDD